MTDQPTVTARRRGPLARNQARHAAPRSRRGIVTRAGLTATLCAVAAGATVLTGAAPSSAATATAAAPDVISVNATVRPHVVGYPDCGEVFTVTGTVVNIRASYGTGSAIIGHAYRGDDFIATYRTSYTYSGYYWAYGFDPVRDVGGYIAMAYLHDDGYSAGCTYLQ